MKITETMVHKAVENEKDDKGITTRTICAFIESHYIKGREKKILPSKRDQVKDTEFTLIASIQWNVMWRREMYNAYNGFKISLMFESQVLHDEIDIGVK